MVIQFSLFAFRAVAELLLSSDFNVNHRIGGKRTLLHIAAKYDISRYFFP